MKIVPETGRLTANEIFEAALKNARSELHRSGHKLAFPGVAGGITMGLTGMAVSAVRALAWIVTASHWTIGQMAIIYLLTFVVGAGAFAHCIASRCEILASVMLGTIPVARYLNWLGAATFGNTRGGVLILSPLNYGQVKRFKPETLTR